MKQTKRMISLILSVLLILSTFTCLCISANAKSGDVIYFEKPAEWGDTVYVYYWEGSNTPSWPGNKMTKVSGNIYSYNVKSTFSTLLFCDNGNYQTVDLSYPGNGYICKVGTTSEKNGYGNLCWHATWSKYSAGLSVSATPGNSDFMSTVTVTLNTTS